MRILSGYLFIYLFEFLVSGYISASGRFTPGKDPVRVVQEAGWAPGPVWTGAENLATTGIRSPDRTARSEISLQ